MSTHASLLTLLTLLALLVLPLTCRAQSFSLVDASTIVQTSSSPDYEKMVVMHNGDVTFHWTTTGNTLKASLVHNVPTSPELPDWVGWGVYDPSQLNDGSSVDAATVQLMDSNAVIASKKPNFTMKKYFIGGSELWSPQELAQQTLLSAGFAQNVKEDDGTYITTITFEKLLQESDSEELRIHASGSNLFWWGWGIGNGITTPQAHGAFALDLSAAAGNVPAPAPKTSAPVVPKPTIPLDSLSMDPDTLMTEWLTAHNTRRTAFFASNSVGDVPLKWSSDLAYSAQAYADKLIQIDGCVIMHRYQGDKYGGENLYKSWAKPPATTDKTPEDACLAWFEGEEFKEYPSNGHRTQVAWRGSKYVGCGQAKKEYNGESCFISACRYMAPANCNVQNGDWLTPLLLDSSLCPPQCPAEGCF